MIALGVAPLVANVDLATGVIELVIGAGEAARAALAEQVAPHVAIRWAAPGDSTSNGNPTIAPF